MKTRRERIIGTIDDLVSDLLYYDRKESSELPLGAIEEAVAAGEVTVEEMVAKFKGCLEGHFVQLGNVDKLAEPGPAKVTTGIGVSIANADTVSKIEFDIEHGGGRLAGKEAELLMAGRVEEAAEACMAALSALPSDKVRAWIESFVRDVENRSGSRALARPRFDALDEILRKDHRYRNAIMGMYKAEGKLQ